MPLPPFLLVPDILTVTKSERHFDVLVLVSGKMTQTKANGEFVRNVTDKMSVTFPLVLTDIVSVSTFTESKFHLAFLQFFRTERPNLALSPYFYGSVRFDRIIEIGEQTGPLQEIFKGFLKMVPLCLRFFSYL